MFDAHCHLDRCADPEAALRRARAAGVADLVLAGVDPPGWAAQRRLAAAHAGLHLTAGVHPEVVATHDDSQVDAMLDALHRRLAEGGLVALGEAGLDHRRPFVDSRARQLSAFRHQLELARSHRLPLVLHVVAAHGAALDALEPFAPLRGMVHSFSGSAEVGLRYLALGLHLSFAGTVCNPIARKVREAAMACPLERLLVETDAPDQLPSGITAVENEPAFLEVVATALARLRHDAPHILARRTTENARTLYGV